MQPEGVIAIPEAARQVLDSACTTRPRLRSEAFGVLNAKLQPFLVGHSRRSRGHEVARLEILPLIHK
jgi:hypothetical protein